MATVTLASIRAAAEAKYGDYTIDLGEGRTVTLKNALRLSKDRRDALVAAQEAAGDDQESVIASLLAIVAETQEQADALIEAAAGDLTILVEIFTQYGESTQAGEA